MEHKVIYHVATDSLKDFEKCAEQVRELGGTHMMVGDLPRSRWMWERDLKDPYSNWSMGHAQLFKLVCPPQLKPYLPQEHIAECMELVQARCDILKKLGLRPALFSNEPFWLPEEVYRDHPQWRGARCDHPRRSTKPYYSPCIDQPEVLSMYRTAMRELVRRTGIDFFNFMSNDSGGGVCWSGGTYVGPNGPSHCRNRMMADRIAGFIDALSEGAREGGADAVIHFNANIDFKAPEEQIGSVWPRLKENQIVNSLDCHGMRPITIIADLGAPKQPVKRIPRMVRYAGFLQQARQADTPIVVVDMPRSDFEEAFICGRKALHRPLNSMADCLDLLRDTACEIAGSACEPKLLDAWYHIDESYKHLSHTGLDLIMYGCQHQRWINRPFLLFPLELPEEEKEYYRKYQFQALTEEDAADLMNLQGIEGVRGFTSAFLITQTVLQARKSMDKAIDLLQQILEDKESRMDAEKLSLLIRRLRVQECFYDNIANAVQFQELADRTDFETPPQLSLRWPTRDDRRIEEFQNITRAEIDNVTLLADLLDGYEEQILLMTDEAHEDIFLYGPHFVEQLRKKAEIMWDHMLDGSRVYVTHNI